MSLILCHAMCPTCPCCFYVLLSFLFFCLSVLLSFTHTIFLYHVLSNVIPWALLALNAFLSCCLAGSYVMPCALLAHIILLSFCPVVFLSCCLSVLMSFCPVVFLSIVFLSCCLSILLSFCPCVFLFCGLSVLFFLM